MSSPLDVFVYGPGYVGRPLLTSLLAEDRHVGTLSRDAGQPWFALHPKLHVVEGNVCDRELVARLPPARVVVQCLGYDRAGTDSKHEVTVEGLRHVLETLPDCCERFLFVSSTSVYGQSDGESVDERSPAVATTAAGTICREAERLVETLAPARRAILRFAGLYGPERLLRARSQLAGGEPLPGTGEEFLNLLHRDDAAAILHEALGDHDWPALLLASDCEPVRRRDYYSRLAELYGLEPPQFDGSERQGRPISNRRCDSRQLHSHLVQPFRYSTYRKGLEDAIRSHV